jgi:hypothetical protein
MSFGGVDASAQRQRMLRCRAKRHEGTNGSEQFCSAEAEPRQCEHSRARR